jgi:hypothetical protein
MPHSYGSITFTTAWARPISHHFCQRLPQACASAAGNVTQPQIKKTWHCSFLQTTVGLEITNMSRETLGKCQWQTKAK